MDTVTGYSRCSYKGGGGVKVRVSQLCTCSRNFNSIGFETVRNMSK